MSMKLSATESAALGGDLDPSSPTVVATIVGEQSTTIGDLFPGWSDGFYIGLKGEAIPVQATDAVRGIVGLDREKFAAANAAKKKVHCWHGREGTFTSDAGLLDVIGPCVMPWIGHIIGLCPLLLAPQIKALCCAPHRDMEWPEWADKALVYTEHGIVGKQRMEPDAKTHAILWGGFDVDKVEVHRYGEPHTKGCQNLCDKGHYGLDARPVRGDPLTIPMLVGLALPCCAFICCQPDKSHNLYHLKVTSTHMTTEGSGDNAVTYPTGSISLIALAPSAEACFEELRSQAEKAVVTPDTLNMVRGGADESAAAGPQMQLRVGCSVM
jgi:hypothetical protein